MYSWTAKKRIWIGYNATGLVMYDQAKGATHWWKSTDKGENTIIGDVVAGIVEDKKWHDMDFYI